ncbi:hypothetical protein MMC26_001982 [Xylographa opegraphella]|nr:hypothetical protein [Xylographa opegraphella]
MGIPGLYHELGKGKREAFAKFAIEQLEKTGRPLRLAVDISIWQFQILSGKGGKNPALRTLYFRLLRFLALPIEPLFVFDGPHKPPMKRNLKTGNQGASLPNMLAKELLKHFGFPYLTAPGEAEAECALLQREGIVDAVMSEDVDTLMFGCGMSMRDWSGEGKSKVPSHVNIYSAELIKRKYGLDRDGMVLIALMSGGDYDTVGIPGCGPKVACQAARAGFGKELCKLAKDDIVGFKQWREKLNYELRTNESSYFQRKNKTIQVPDNFPDKKIFSYYARPVISSAEKIADLRSSIRWYSPADIHNLRIFVADAFEWHYLEGAFKFIRGLAPALLNQRLRHRAGVSAANPELQAEEEQKYVKGVCDKSRTHFDTGGIKEIRVIYMPAEITALDLEKEESGQYAGICSSDSETEVEAIGPVGEEEAQCTSPTKKRDPSLYDPTIPDRIWIPETIAQLGIPLMMEDWEADMRNPKKFATRKGREKTAMAPGGMKKGAIDAFVKVKKYDVARMYYEKQAPLGSLENDRAISPELMIPSADMENFKASDLYVDADGNENVKAKVPTTPSKVTKKTRKKRAPVITDSPVRHSDANPWTLSRRPSDTFDVNQCNTKRYSALGINCSPRTPDHGQHQSSSKAGDVFEQPILVESPLSNKNAKSRQEFTSGTSTVAKRTYVKEKHQSGVIHDDLERTHAGVTPRTNRRLDFGTAVGIPVALSTPQSPSLPSPSALLRSRPPKPDTTFHRQAATRPHAREPLIPKSSKKHIMLRSSLNGAWRDMDDWELELSTPERVLSGVEFLDLTRS